MQQPSCLHAHEVESLDLRSYFHMRVFFRYDVNLLVLALHHGRVETQLIFIKEQQAIVGEADF